MNYSISMKYKQLNKELLLVPEDNAFDDYEKSFAQYEHEESCKIKTFTQNQFDELQERVDDIEDVIWKWRTRLPMCYER